MADESSTSPEEVPAKKKSGIMALIKPLALIGVIVLIEVAIVSAMIPSADETVEIAQKLATFDANQELLENGDVVSLGEDDVATDLADMNEVLLGTFHVLNYNPETGTRININFELYGTVLAEEESEFYPLFEANEHRIREQIQITVRGADVTDLSDAGLGLIKRKILEKTNRALGKTLLHEAIFSKFAFEER